MKMSEKTLLKKIEQAFAENYCTGSYKLEILHEDEYETYEALERYVLRKCDELIRYNHLKPFWISYIAQQLDEVKRNTIYLYAPYITAHRNIW